MNITTHKVGTFLSIGCAIHCLLQPFVLAALPMLGVHFHLHEHTEMMILTIAFSLVAIGSIKNFFIHKKLFSFGLLGLAGALIFISHDIIPSLHETLSLAGAFTLAGVTLLDTHLCRSCKCHKHD